MDILILSSKEKSNATKTLYEAATDRGHNVDVLDPLQLAMYVSNDEGGYDRIYDNYKKNFDRIYLGKYDVIIPRLTNLHYASYILELMNKNIRIKSIQSAEGLRMASNKLSTTLRLSASGLPVPKTILSKETDSYNTLIDKIGSFPVVIKTNSGSQGKGVTIVKDSITLKSLLQTLNVTRVNHIIQEYIDYKQDVRAIVVGGKVVAAMERTKIKSDFRANLSLGAEGKPVKLSDADKWLCIAAAEAINLDVCGVDLLKTKNKTYINEVNGNFGFKIEKVTHINIARKIVEYAEYMVNIRKTPIEHFTSYDYVKSMQNKNDKLQKRIDYYDNSYLRQLANRYNGSTCTYIDRDEKKKRVRIKSVHDIFELVNDTFELHI